jgi:hypothetical protein
MDDMKRKMYMRAKNSVLAGKMPYLYWALIILDFLLTH